MFTIFNEFRTLRCDLLAKSVENQQIMFQGQLHNAHIIAHNNKLQEQLLTSSVLKYLLYCFMYLNIPYAKRDCYPNKVKYDNFLNS